MRRRSEVSQTVVMPSDPRGHRSAGVRLDPRRRVTVPGAPRTSIRHSCQDDIRYAVAVASKTGTSDRTHVQLRLTVDLVILTVRDGALQVLLVERGNAPFRGRPALPGGFLRPDEDIRDAAVRELAEETGLNGDALPLRQLRVFGSPDRDPRGRIVTVPYLAIAPNLPSPIAGSDATTAKWWPVDALDRDGTSLAFDHDDILRLAIAEAGRELEDTTVATAFCGETFTIGELRRIYELVWGQALDPRNFNRKVTKADGFLEPVGTRPSREPGRPAMLYRAGPAKRLYPPMLRPNGSEEGAS